MRARSLELQSMGFVPVATAPMLVDPRSTAHRREWWNRHFAAAEYGNPEGGYAQMPDDWTPERSGGQSLTGNRRTHRMAYVGENVALRMPSVASIKSFSDANVTGKATGETFDVPVSAQFPGGQIDGWVRVARGEDGTWATQGLGFTSEQSAYVAESVQCVLEARRPSRALADAGDLLERRRRRAAELGTPMQPIRSSWIKDVGYHRASGTMVMTTDAENGTKVYGFEVPIAAFLRVANAEAPGRVFNQIIRGKSKKIEVKECAKCDHAYVTPQHRCPVNVSTRKRYLPRLALIRERLARGL